MTMKPSALSAEQVAALTRRHSELEERGELEPLLETMVAEPIFEFHPPGGSLSGGETLRRYYRNFLANFMPLVEDTHLLGEWVDARATVVEYQIRLRVDGALEDHQLVAVMYASEDRMGGERLYGSERLIRLMLGPLVDELVPIEGVSNWATR